jgi:predicted SAM-dependent methyltransferase
MRRFIRLVANIPFFGYFVRLAIVVYRLPHFYHSQHLNNELYTNHLLGLDQRLEDRFQDQANRLEDRFQDQANRLEDRFQDQANRLEEQSHHHSADLENAQRELADKIDKVRLEQAELLTGMAENLAEHISDRAALASDLELFRSDFSDLVSRVHHIDNSWSSVEALEHNVAVLVSESQEKKLSIPVALRELKRSQKDLEAALSQAINQLQSRVGREIEELAFKQAAELDNCKQLIEKLEGDSTSMQSMFESRFELGKREALFEQRKQIQQGILTFDTAVQQLALSLYEVKSAVNQLSSSQVKTRGEINASRDQFVESQRQLDSKVLALESSIGLAEQKLTNDDQVMKYLAGRVEFVRRELLYEFRYGKGGEDHPKSTFRTKREVINPEKIEQALQQEQVKLNLGCGHIPLDGFLNVDRRVLPGVDIVAEIDDIPFDSKTVDQIHSEHCLEHFPEEEMKRKLFPYFFSLLRPGGVFSGVVPDFEAMIVAYRDDQLEYSAFREVVFGSQDYEGDFHYNMFTPDSITLLLEEAGFAEVKILESGRKNGMCLEFEFTSVKPKTKKRSR